MVRVHSYLSSVFPFTEARVKAGYIDNQLKLGFVNAVTHTTINLKLYLYKVT